MTEERAINLYYYLINNKAPKRELDVVINLLNQQYQIDLSRLERKRHRPQNRFDINSYGAGGSRTMNQTRQLGQ
ncbi:hypothetical protein [Photobacterium lutimaris]|uniref:Uncharacterized protein n=1 Tax=Photobacterium lutimaris TaxID=388278 RepID=A0A2T3IZE0_9GAMM|nr:hypothetical protein [Photobacterium lutimaris]PSU34030.1 hypothetical protein C9I99_11765 [Photobacterium lutimaris]TDR76371.1 hypothetical protein DFP78_103368 [Photobacterium lutimaris]